MAGGAWAAAFVGFTLAYRDTVEASLLERLAELLRRLEDPETDAG